MISTKNVLKLLILVFFIFFAFICDYLMISDLIYEIPQKPVAVGNRNTQTLWFMMPLPVYTNVSWGQEVRGGSVRSGPLSSRDKSVLGWDIMTVFCY